MPINLLVEILFLIRKEIQRYQHDINNINDNIIFNIFGYIFEH